LHCRLDLPADRLAELIGAWHEPALLESGPGFGSSGRWCIYAAEPRLTFEAEGGRWRVQSGPLAESGRCDALGALDRLLRKFKLADPTESPEAERPPFQGGMIGFFGYDLAPRLERLPRRAPRDSRLPDIRFSLYDTAVTFDRSTGRCQLWAFDLKDEGGRATQARFERWRRRLEPEQGAQGTKPISRHRGSRIGPASSNFSRRDYLAAVRQVLEYIAAGDIFQVNLSHRFTAHGRPEPLDLYLRLRDRSPAPFAAYLHWDELAVMSASPEWFYQTRGDSIVTRPIKGTRPRGASRDEDKQLAAQLLASAKDRAELTMIVDLERNDLGRVCRYGTVVVSEPLVIESYAQVHHLLATVEGRLRLEAGPVDVVKALFPGGSITGAPKIRAMEIIDELEPTRRSLYTGAIGYFSRGGMSGFNIAIRTLIVEGDRASYQVGGGIVADSDPEAEYDETMHKGRGLREVLEGKGEAQ
jgi:para-aminobenzoate synthetase component 1